MIHVDAPSGEELRELEQLRRALSPDGYTPHDLHPKQREFMTLAQLEALFGGAAGGGKTDALLAAALAHVDKPQYSALLLRRTYPALKLRGSIMDRAHNWLDGTDAKWNEVDKKWTFPSGATLQFGYCNTEADLDRYKSANFHFIGIDELTEWPERWYGFLFSRLRRNAGDEVPLAMRAATNPDGLGAEWVRRRFHIPLNEVISAPIVGDDCVFIPSRVEDNPSLDLEAYEKSLAKMTGSTQSARYQQLRWGRWMRDSEGMVYAFDEGRNRLKIALDLDDTWRFVLGLDFGFVDSTAFTVNGWRPFDPKVYVVESFKKAKLTPSGAAQQVVKLRETYKFQRIVGDVGGLGKGYAEEARNRFKLPIEPADKVNKRGYIDLLNGDLLEARLMLFPGNEALEKEWLELPWDPDRRLPADGFEDHLADAELYNWRACHAYLAKEPPANESGDPTEAANLAAAIAKAAFLKKRKKDADKSWWQRGRKVR